MSFPELPDDRRAPPRRYRGSADPVAEPVEGDADPSDDPRGNGRVTPPRGARHDGRQPADRAGVHIDDPAVPHRRSAEEPGGRRRASTETGRHAAAASTVNGVDDRRPGNGYPTGGNGNGVGDGLGNGHGNGQGNGHGNGHGNGGYRGDGRPVDRVRDAYPFDGSDPDRGSRGDAHRRDPVDPGPPAPRPADGDPGYDDAWYNRPLDGDPRYDGSVRGGDPTAGNSRYGEPRGSDPLYDNRFGVDPRGGDPLYGGSDHRAPRNGDLRADGPRNGEPGPGAFRDGNPGHPGYPGPGSGDVGNGDPRTGHRAYGDPRNGSGRDRAERHRYAEPEDQPRRRDGRAGEPPFSAAPGERPPAAGPDSRTAGRERPPPMERPDGYDPTGRRSAVSDGRDPSPEAGGRFRDGSRRAGPPPDGRDARRPEPVVDEWDDPRSRRTRAPEQPRRQPEAAISADLDGAATPGRPADDRRADDRRAAHAPVDGTADTTRRVRREPDVGRPSTPGRTAVPVPVPSDDPEPETEGLPVQDDIAEVETRAIPVRRRGDPEAPEDRDLPDAGDETVVRPRRRRLAGRPGDPDPDDRALDDGAEPDETLDDDPDEDSGTDASSGPRDGKGSGPVGIGGKLARLTSRRSGPDGTKKPTSFWKELPLLVGVALVLTFLIQTFVAKVFVIPSGSMETTLHGCSGCTNDRVLVDKVTYNFTSIHPGDVVVFRGPPNWSDPEYETEKSTNPVVRGLETAGSLIGFAPPDEEDFVKRVIAVGGQTVACCDALNQLMVDGQPLDEPYIYYLPEAGPARQIPFGPIKVPDGDLWMMGDSRNNSADSRAAGHGPVPEDNVIGKVRLIVIPFNRFGWVDAVDPQTAASAAGDAGLPQGTPLALGMMGTFPLAWSRRRTLRLRAEEERFMPAVRRPKRPHRRA